jgi:hypothetical protein
MYVSLRDVASLATISFFLTATFTWADILQAMA